jgi:AcrR family transcriptional regulator
MTVTSRITSKERRAAIIRAARAVFVEKGFDKATTHELAEAAGVSEALVFKHFASKEALYSAILTSFFKEESTKRVAELKSLKPSTATLVFLVEDLVTHVLETQDEDQRSFFRLIMRSLMDEGEFTRAAIQGAPLHWVKKVEECIVAAKKAGDMLGTSVCAGLGGWFVHQLISGILMHSLPAVSVIDYRVSRAKLRREVVQFSLRGMGLKEAAIRQYCNLAGLRMR